MNTEKGTSISPFTIRLEANIDIELIMIDIKTINRFMTNPPFILVQLCFIFQLQMPCQFFLKLLALP